MNIGEVLVKFGAETSGFMGGLRLIQAAMSGLGGFTKGALSDMNSGLHSITTGFQTMGTGAGGVFSSLRVGAQDVGTGLLKLGAVMAIVGVVAAAAIGVTVGVIAVRAFADFQQGMNRLVTGAGDVTDNMKQMGQSILGISVATGVLTGELLPAMYQIISAGQRGATAQNTLKVAAMGAVAEQAKVVDVAKALTTAMTDYGTSQFNATQFMNGYTRATQLGKITLEELSTSMGPILPLAKNIGISFADVAGAMSTMTNAGIPAERAATSLRFLFQSLENPTHKATVAMESMGLSSVAVGNELKKSLPGALEMIYKAALKAGPEGSVPFNRAISDMIGGQRSLQSFLSLTGSHFATYSANTRAVATAMNGSKTAVLGWDVAQQNFNTKMGQAHAALDAVFITIGSHLLPVLSQIVGQITPIIQKFADWVTHTNAIENAIKAVTPFFNAMFDIIKAALPVVVGLFLQFMAVLGQVFKWVAQHKEIMEALMVIMKALGIIIVAVVAAGLLTLVGTFILVSAAIIVVMAVVAGLIAIWKLLVVAANWVAGAWNSAIAWLGGAWHSLVGIATSAFNAVKNAIVTAFNAVISWISGAWNSAIAWLGGAWHSIAGLATQAWNAVKTAIVGVVDGIVNWLKTAWQNAVNFIVGAFTWLYNHNYYWKALVDFIRNTVQGVITWLQTAWQNVVTFLGGLWNSLKGLATNAWNGVRDAVMSVVNPIIAWIKNEWNLFVIGLGIIWDKLSGLATKAWNAVKTAIMSVVNPIIAWIKNEWNLFVIGLGIIWDKLKGLAQKAWDAVTGVFKAVWGTISGILNTLAKNISGWFNDLKGQMIQFGKNLIQGLIDGINSMIGAVGNAANNIASTITGILGFHSPPKYGPAADADTWMPNMVNLLTKGMTSGVPSMTKAATQLAQPIQGNLSASGGTRPAAASSSGQRPIIIQVGNREYRAFVENLGRDLGDKVILQMGGLR